MRGAADAPVEYVEWSCLVRAFAGSVARHGLQGYAAAVGEFGGETIGLSARDMLGDSSPSCRQEEEGKQMPGFEFHLGKF